jgi:mycofactocin system creatininase family protein
MLPWRTWLGHKRVTKSAGAAKKYSARQSTTYARQLNSSYDRRVAVVGALGSSTSSDLRGQSTAVIVPVGSTEQHGPHLPLDTDTRIATAVAHGMLARLADAPGCVGEWRWLVAPAIGYGASGEHQSFPGTISIGTEALVLLLVEYGRSAACWASRLLFVNGHGGNVAALQRAADLLRSEGRDVAWCACTACGADAHAGHTETSLLLHISPAAVRTERWCAGNGAPLSDLLASIRSGGVAAVSEVGVLGDPTTATAADGGRILAELVDGCMRRLARWAPGADGMLT